MFVSCMFTLWWLIDNWAWEWSGQAPFKPDISFKDKNLTSSLTNFRRHRTRAQINFPNNKRHCVSQSVIKGHSLISSPQLCWNITLQPNLGLLGSVLTLSNILRHAPCIFLDQCISRLSHHSLSSGGLW